MNMPNLDETRQRAIRAALGQAPFDVLLVNGTVIDTATSELREADIGLAGPWIASVHPRGTRSDAALVEDLSGGYVAPGFIDIHVHFESSHLTPENYADRKSTRLNSSHLGTPYAVFCLKQRIVRGVVEAALRLLRSAAHTSELQSRT